MFEESRPTTQIASNCGVSEKSVRERRRRWTAGGTAALASCGPGGSDCKLSAERQRLMLRTRRNRGRPGERGSFSENDYIAFLDQAHQRLWAPIVLVWDNLNTHVSRRMHALIAARHWLTVVPLPAYAPDLNPTEGVWSWMKRGITNIAVHGVDHLADIAKQRLRACQQQTDLLASFPAQTGTTLDPETAMTMQTSAFQPLQRRPTSVEL